MNSYEPFSMRPLVSTSYWCLSEVSHGGSGERWLIRLVSSLFSELWTWAWRICFSQKQEVLKKKERALVRTGE